MSKKRRILFYVGMLTTGAIGGAVYWYFWGCTNSCVLWSKWELMSLRGGAIGGLLAAILDPWIFKKKISSENTKTS